MVIQGILSVIGNTPLVRLGKAVIECDFNVYAKLEGSNPGGSIKDRPALEIIRQGMESGQIGNDTVIVEATSGNMGVGLAQVCRYFNLRFICVTDPKISKQNLKLLKTYGAEVEVVEKPDPLTGDYLPARIGRAQEIASSLEDAFWVNQYANLSNAQAHYNTMEEIAVTLNGVVDYVFVCASSCGTLRGCSEYVRQKWPGRTKIYAADAVGSIVFGGSRGKRLVPGHGAGIRPALYMDGLADRSVQVSDWECVIGCRRLLEEEALLVGGSSGAAFMALERVKAEIPSGANCVLVFPDRGERYLDTIYADSWVQEHFGRSVADFEKGMLLNRISSVAVMGSAGHELIAEDK